MIYKIHPDCIWYLADGAIRESPDYRFDRQALRWRGVIFLKGLASLYNYADVRGFNYQPSYATSGYEVWQKFDPVIVERELRLGKQHFPTMNSVRIWLAWDYFTRHPKVASDHFETVLTIANELGFSVMPCLYNRWHSGNPDYGGVYIDHIMKGVTYGSRPGMFEPFLNGIVGEHANDPRIFAWDLCNEPFTYLVDQVPDILKAEMTWLEETYATCKQLGAQAPLTISILQLDVGGLERVEPFSDFLSIHPYWFEDSPPPVMGIKHHSQADFERMLDGYVEFAASVNKSVLVTEACWGSLDDARRSRNVGYSLGEFKKRGLGWLAYLLHHSLVADSHRPEFGPVGHAGTTHFIEADGTLRPGHEIFNQY